MSTPYTLTLTSGERKAIDWVGHRYAHGDDLSNVLLSCDWVCLENDKCLECGATLGQIHLFNCGKKGGAGHVMECDCRDDADWNSPHDLTFLISEPDAWAIQSIADDEDHRWDCFARSLVAKLETFLETIV